MWSAQACMPDAGHPDLERAQAAQGPCAVKGDDGHLVGLCLMPDAGCSCLYWFTYYSGIVLQRLSGHSHYASDISGGISLGQVASVRTL